MKAKGVFWAAMLLLLASVAFYLLRFTSLFKSTDYSTDLLNAAFAEQPVGYFNHADTAVNVPEIQHVSVWVHAHTTVEQFASSFRQLDPDKDILVTAAIGEHDGLRMVTGGNFDDAFRALCQALPDKKRVYLRWDPDMEVPVRRFSWQYQSPQDYISAFRHIAKICRREAPQLKIMWSPAGYPGTEEYWPGADMVDVVGISMNGQSEKEATAYPAEPDMREALRRKIIRTRFMNKPVLVLASAADSLCRVLQSDLKMVVKELHPDAGFVFQADSVGPVAKRPEGTIPLLGVYDPEQELTASKPIQVEHLFIDLGNIQTGKFAEEFNAIIRRGHQAIVTVEPWRDNKVRKDTSALRNTMNGVYDEEFKELFHTIAAANQTVYVRFAHEMEIPIHRYSWQSKDPILYIKAFRHFMELAKGIKNVRKVWGPAGDRGSMEWYPGGDYVDFISIAIYGLPDKNITDPSKQESFETIFDRKVWRMRMASKPFFVTEFGVKGPDDFQKQWMEGAARVLASHKEVWGASYFNLADNPEVWGNIPAPDWGISHAILNHFVEELRENN